MTRRTHRRRVVKRAVLPGGFVLTEASLGDASVDAFFLSIGGHLGYVRRGFETHVLRAPDGATVAAFLVLGDNVGGMWIGGTRTDIVRAAARALAPPERWETSLEPLWSDDEFIEMLNEYHLRSHEASPWRTRLAEWWNARPGPGWSITLDGPFLRVTHTVDLREVAKTMVQAERRAYVKARAGGLGGRHAWRAWRALVRDPRFKALGGTPPFSFYARGEPPDWKHVGPIGKFVRRGHYHFQYTLLVPLVKEVFARVALPSIRKELAAFEAMRNPKAPRGWRG